MRNLVEAGLDVTLHDPVIRAGREIAQLGHRVMSPALRAEPVGTREEIRLEDRLEHQLHRCLDHPIGDRRDPEATQLAVGLGNHPLPHRHRAETAVLQRRPQPVEEHLDALLGLEGEGSLPIHSGRASTLIAPHPIPRHQQERRIADEVEQIIEPAMSIITGPSMQFGLDLPYPTLGSIKFKRQLVGIHRRSPGLPASSLPACWPPWPCGRLSRPPWRVVTPATTTGPPPRPTSSAGNAPARSRTGCTGEGRGRTVPAFTTQPIDGVGVQLCPSGIATTTPWAFTVASRRGASSPARSSRPAQGRSVRTATQPISARLELVGRLRGFTHWFLTYAFPSC